MNFEELALSRISEKLSKGNNFRNVVQFTSSIFDNTRDDIMLIKDLKNLSSERTIVLDEIGKLLGLFPRPLIEIGVTGEGFMTWDVTGWDTVPFFISGSDSIRPLTDSEYSKTLKAVATLTTFRGTMDDWLMFLNALTDGDTFIVNKRSSFDIIVQKELTQFEKNLIDFLVNKINNLTVSKNFIGTTDGTQPMQWDVTGWDTVPFVDNW